jgi:integration host factor subunit alpha
METPMTLTKADIIDSLYNSTELSKDRSSELIEALLEIIKQKLEQGEDVLISSFGKFYVKEKNPRRGRNPQTGEDLMLGERRVVIFKCSKRLRDRVNGRR